MTTFTAPMYRTTRTAQQILADLGEVPHGTRDWAWKLTAADITAMDPDDRPYYLTPHQAAQVLGCSRQTLSRMAEMGRLVFVRPDKPNGNGMRRYNTASVYDFAESRTGAAPSRPGSGEPPAGARGGTGAPPGDHKTPARAVSEGCVPGPD